MARDSGIHNDLMIKLVAPGLGAFLDWTNTLIALVDGRGRSLAGNRAFEELRRALPSGDSIFDSMPASQRELLHQQLRSTHPSPQPAPLLLEFIAADKHLQYTAILVPAGPDTFILFGEPVLTDLDLRAANEKLNAELIAAKSALADKTAELHAFLAQADQLAHTDSLTFLPNRGAIISDLHRHVTYSERYGTPLAVSMMDLDGFKEVNDTYGHPAGDTVLAVVARELRERIRQPDEIGRYGGDEFLVILPNTTAAAASEQAARLCQHVRSTPIPFGDGTIRLSLSAGIAQLRPAADTWQTLLDRADRALLEAKRQGGDQWLILES